MRMGCLSVLVLHLKLEAICSQYCHSQSRIFSEFIKRFCDLLYLFIILTWDIYYNFPLNSSNLTDLIYLLKSFNIAPNVDSPSRITPKSKTLLDNILTNCDLIYITSSVNETSSYYHLPVIANLTIYITNTPNQPLKRSFSKANISLFLHHRNPLSWYFILSWCKKIVLFYIILSILIKLYVQSIPNILDRFSNNTPLS
jgi:hypothetical protein